MKNQKGFTAIEGLLILIAVTLIGFVGYYVWHTQKQTDKTLDQADKSSQSSVIKPTQKYYTIKEWNVRAPYDGDDTFTYQFAVGVKNSALFISKHLADKYGCNNTGAGEVDRFLPSDDVSDIYMGVSAGTTASQDASANPEDYTHVGGYYYRFTHDKFTCSDSVTSEAENSANDTVKNLVSHFQVISN
jgi:flagellin-like protein